MILRYYVTGYLDRDTVCRGTFEAMHFHISPLSLSNAGKANVIASCCLALEQETTVVNLIFKLWDNRLNYKSLCLQR